MPNITVKCANPEMMRLVVTAEMTTHEWREILKRHEASDLKFYGPLNDFLSAIERGLNELEKREVIHGQ